jgi:hypothetical protein
VPHSYLYAIVSAPVRADRERSRLLFEHMRAKYGTRVEAVAISTAVAPQEIDFSKFTQQYAN